MLFRSALCLFLAISVATGARAQLILDASASSSVVRATNFGETQAVVVTASNGGTQTLSGVSVSVLLPGAISTFRRPTSSFFCPGDCDASETASWDVGTLAPGQSKTIALPITPFSNTPPDTDLVLVASGSGAAAQALITVKPDQAVDIGVSAPGGPTSAGQPLDVEVAFSNRTQSPTGGIVITMPVPSGTSFASATHGGVLNGNEVRWSLSSLARGAGGRVTATFTVENSATPGSLIKASAKVTSTAPAQSVTGSTTVTVAPGRGLSLGIASSGHALIARNMSGDIFSETSAVTVTAVNQGTVALTGVTVDVLLPDGIITFGRQTSSVFCSGDCDNNETAQWDIGTLAPGQARSISFALEPFIDTAIGQVLYLRAAATSGAGGASASESLWFQDEPQVSVSVSRPETSTRIEAGAEVDFAVLVGNRSSVPAQSLQAHLGVPHNTTFVSATEGGSLDGSVVRWQLGPFGPNAGRELKATFRISNGTPPGALITAHASVTDPGAGSPVGAGSRVVAVTETVPGPVRITATRSRAFATPNQVTTVILTATNTGTLTRTVSVNVLLPDGVVTFRTPTSSVFCPGDCDNNETAQWDVGTLTPGQSASLALPLRTFSNIAPGRTISLVASTTAQATSSYAQADVFIGTEAIVTDAVAAPANNTEFAVSAGPNPFLDATTITVLAPASSRTEVAAYDVLGRRVATLYDGPAVGGRAEYVWNTSELAPGIYVVRLVTGEHTAAIRVIKINR